MKSGIHNSYNKFIKKLGRSLRDMETQIRRYTDQAGYTEDFSKICDFLIRINNKNVITPNYLWARWVWQFGPYINCEKLSQIGVAEEDGIIVGLATYEDDIGEVYFCVDEEYPHIKKLLVEYAIEHLSADGKLKMSIKDGDFSYQQIAIEKGFIPTTVKSSVALFDTENYDYILPEGFRIISFDDEGFDVERYYNAIWRGFDNQRQPNEKELKSMEIREGFDAPHFDLSLRIVVVAPNGDYAAHCGMWCIENSGYAYVEPVFTLPEYRKMGLGKAAVLEGIKRCAKLGSKKAYVLSSIQFYYSIGFYPIQNETWWVNY